MSRFLLLFYAVIGRFPRSRGDEPLGVYKYSEDPQFSPLTRG